MESTVVSPHDKHLFGYTPMPEWVDEFRDNQYEIIEQINEAFKSVDVVMLQAPTGTGKSLIGECTRRLMGGNSIYACTTKALQDQFVHDFPYARVIKGRANYLTESGILDEFGNPAPAHYRYSKVTCADCTYTPATGECRWCMTRTLCPYQVAKAKAEQADLAVLNTSYLFTVANKVGNSGFLGRNLAILDEADLLEQEMLSHVEVEISNRRMALMNIEPPFRKTVAKSWLEWVEQEALPKVRLYKDSIPNPSTTRDMDDIREWDRVNELLSRLGVLLAELKGDDPKWVYDGYDEGNIIFRPIKVGKFGNQLLWPHADKFLLMSATILSADLMADELGLTGSYDLIDVPSNFPIENRRINVCPIADMAYSNREQAWPAMVDGIRGVLKRHEDERILVHTVSYELARYINDNIRVTDRPIVTYTNSRNKGDALEIYKARPNSVLLAPSMDRGIDLPDDLCRVQVVAKIPYPNVKDKRISARMHSTGGKGWYAVQTIRTLIQMTGRGIRSKDDHATTYILDRQFVDNLGKSNKHLFPRWWADALNYKFPPRRLLGE